MKEFMPLVTSYLRYFSEVGEPALLTIFNCKVPSDLILAEYERLIPIELLLEKERRELWEYTKLVLPDRPKEEQIRFSKIVYAIGTLL
jgi:hypothetical protein